MNKNSILDTSILQSFYKQMEKISEDVGGAVERVERGAKSAVSGAKNFMNKKVFEIPPSVDSAVARAKQSVSSGAKNFMNIRLFDNNKK